MRKNGENKALYQWLALNGFTRRQDTCEFGRWEKPNDLTTSKIWRVWLHGSGCQAEIKTGVGYKTVKRETQLKTPADLEAFFNTITA